ncbi:ferritin-like domain-containing protein [Nitratifractor sp.]
MNGYDELEKALRSGNPDLKERIAGELLEHCNTEEIWRSDTGRSPQNFSEPSYGGFCRIVNPRDLPRRRNFASTEGLAVLVHSILHIEYSAIDLAMDAVYRFREMPAAYRRDWLEVAADEIRHFGMLREILRSLGYDYGDFPVHRGLFDAAVHTASDALERMAVIPRHYEATGLDVNPQIVRKLLPHRSRPEVARLLEALEIIYREEIEHVRKGDRWFRYLCERRGLEPAATFRRILRRYALDKKERRINVEARKSAGFSCPELRELGAERCEE